MADKFQKAIDDGKPLGYFVDLYRERRDLRLAMQKEVNAVAEEEKLVKDYLIDNIPKSGNTGVAGKKFRAQIKTKDVPRAEDWDKVYNFITENERFDMLQKRLSDKAVTDMWEAGETIPGVGKFTIVDVSVTNI